MGSIPTPEYDVVVVGAGFGGLASLYFLKQLGLRVQGIDAASDVGGTWHWNRYPGARSDSESYIYRLSLDRELLETDGWKNSYVTQPDLESYFQQFAKRNGLYPLIQFKTELTAATWDESSGRWELQYDTGETVWTRYLITAIGILHKPQLPDIPGQDSFKGEQVHSARWTEDATKLINKKIAVIGTGASGVQLVGSLSKTAEELTHFVRHAQYVLPARIRPVGPEERALINARYNSIWTEVFTSAVAMGFTEPNRPAMSVSAADRERIFQDLWDQGSGFRFMFGGFSDLGSHEPSNQAAIDFIHRKIKEIVKDPQKAEALTSSDWFARRPLTDDRFYECFNQENVAAVDLKKTPIVEIVPEGIRTSDGKVHEVDLIVYATGFDSVDGTYYHIDIKGRQGLTLPHQWADGPTTTLGLQTHDFPNLFFVNGPGGPYANNPPVAEITAQYSCELIEHAERLRQGGQGKGVVESTAESDAVWTQGTKDCASKTLFDKTPSWLFGENTKGRARAPRFWFGGVGTWRAMYADSKAEGYRGFKFS